MKRRGRDTPLARSQIQGLETPHVVCRPCACSRVGFLSVDEVSRDQDAPLSWWRLGFDGKALLEAVVGSVVGLIALFSSYDHVSFPQGQLPIQQQWGVWLIAVSLPLVVADAQLAARSRRRDADRALRAENVAEGRRSRSSSRAKSSC
jgi:hypothetical protein